MSKNKQSNVMLFLNSYYASEEQNGSYIFHLNNPIAARRTNVIKAELKKFTIPICFYNMTPHNNTTSLTIVHKNISTSAVVSQNIDIVIPEKNYTIDELITYFSSVSYSGVNIILSYDSQTLKAKLTVSYTGYYIQSITINSSSTSERQLGFLPNQTVSGVDVASLDLIATNALNLNTTSVVFFKTDLNIENRDSYGEKSSILAKIKIDKAFGEILHYSDDTIIDFKLADNYIDHLKIDLLDDDFKQIDLHGLHFHCTISFTFENKGEVTYEDTMLDKIGLHERILNEINDADETDSD